MTPAPQGGLAQRDGLSVPSPLAGEGQGGGYPTARPLQSGSFLQYPHQTPFPGLPPSPALPRKGGGRAASLWPNLTTEEPSYSVESSIP